MKMRYKRGVLMEVRQDVINGELACGHINVLPRGFKGNTYNCPVCLAIHAQSITKELEEIAGLQKRYAGMFSYLPATDQADVIYQPGYDHNSSLLENASTVEEAQKAFNNLIQIIKDYRAALQQKGGLLDRS